jgi:hypothetical protein
MKRAIACTLLAVTAVGCSKTDKFIVDDGLCYRERTERTLGLPLSTSTQLATPKSCGIEADQ